MKKGIIRIFVGIVLICLQLVSFLGNLNVENTLDRSNLFFDVGYYCSYLLPGILGLVFLIFGIKAYKTADPARLIFHSSAKRYGIVLKNIIIALLLVILLLFIISCINTSEFNDAVLCYIISPSFMLVYLLIYYGKKPTYTFSASILFLGAAIFCTIKNNLISNFTHYLNVSIFWYAWVFYVIIPFTTAVLCLVIGILVYKEVYYNLLIRILTIIALGLSFVKVAFLIVTPFTHFGVETIIQDLIFITIIVLPVGEIVKNKSNKRNVKSTKQKEPD